MTHQVVGSNIFFFTGFLMPARNIFLMLYVAARVDNVPNPTLSTLGGSHWGPT